MNKSGSGWVALGAIAVVAAFFMPWLTFEGETARGFALSWSEVVERTVRHAWPLPGDARDDMADAVGRVADRAADALARARDAVAPEPDPVPEDAATLGQQAGTLVDRAVETAGELAEAAPEKIEEVRDAVEGGIEDVKALQRSDPRDADPAQRRRVALAGARAGAAAMYLTALMALFALGRTLANRRAASRWATVAGLWAWLVGLAGAAALGFAAWGAPDPAALDPRASVAWALAAHSRWGAYAFFAGALALFLGGRRLARAWKRLGTGKE